MSQLGDELRALAPKVAVDVAAGAYTEEQGDRLRSRVLRLAHDADESFDAEAVLRFLAAVRTEIKASPKAEITLTTLTPDPEVPIPGVVAVTPVVLPHSLSKREVRQQRHRSQTEPSIFTVQVGSRPAVTSDVAFGPSEVPLLMQELAKREAS